MVAFRLRDPSKISPRDALSLVTDMPKIYSFLAKPSMGTKLLVSVVVASIVDALKFRSTPFA